MTCNSLDFADDTAFECFALDHLGPHCVRVVEPKYVYGRRGGITGKLGTAEEGTRLREELRHALRPLGFGAAYKVLDLLVEHVLRANGTGTGRLTFQEKRQALANPPGTLPVSLDARPELWDRLVALYTALENARHAMTHRRFQVTRAGDLQIFDGSRQLIDSVTSTENAYFVAAVHAVAELVINARDDNRQASIVAFYLNALQSRHGLPLLPAIDPNVHRWLLERDLIDLDDGRWRFEVARARAIIEHQPKPSLWDLRLYAGSRVFVGRWEEVADQSVAVLDFHLATLPGWLVEERLPN
jgi:hypothetical protein